MKNLILISAGGHASEVVWLVERINHLKPIWKIKGYTDPEYKPGTMISGYPVIGDDAWFSEHNLEDIYAICCIGNSKRRQHIISTLPSQLKFATLIDPSVYISPNSNINIGPGTIIGCGSIVTVNIKIGEHVMINNHCTISHDSVIDNFCTLSPNVSLSGNTRLESGVEMGVGSKSIQNICIGTNTLVGAGAVVIKNLPADCTAVGIPAVPISNKQT